MPETQQEIDALLAEVNALENEAGSEEPADRPAGEPLEPSHPASGGPPVSANHTTARGVTGNLSRILQLEVPVIVRLAQRTMPMAEIVNLTGGAIIEFERSADSPLDLMINNKCIGVGHAVKAGENFGLRVTSIGSVRDRVEALGGD